MTADITGTATVAGMEFDLKGEFSYHYENHSFSHEFGTEKCGQYEVDEVEWVDFDGDPMLTCSDYLKYEMCDGRRLSRKRFRHVVRQRVRAACKDLEQLHEPFNQDKMFEIANDKRD
jgi:hypothetical protein